MYQCKRCKTHRGGCNWLDWMVEDFKCPHCGKKVKYLEPTPLGKMFDRMGDVAK